MDVVSASCTAPVALRARLVPRKLSLLQLCLQIPRTGFCQLELSLKLVALLVHAFLERSQISFDAAALCLLRPELLPQNDCLACGGESKLGLYCCPWVRLGIGDACNDPCLSGQATAHQGQ